MEEAIWFREQISQQIWFLVEMSFRIQHRVRLQPHCLLQPQPQLEVERFKIFPPS